MKRLLNYHFAPVTFSAGFVEASIDPVWETFLPWMRDVFNRFQLSHEVASLNGKLADMLASLEPLTMPRERELFMETGTGWTAYFNMHYEAEIRPTQPAVFANSSVAVELQ